MLVSLLAEHASSSVGGQFQPGFGGIAAFIVGVTSTRKSESGP
jgi:hypothetical protein